MPIADNNFLIGLMRGDSESRNLALLRTPGVIDLPMQLSDGRLATVNLEKGAPASASSTTRSALGRAKGLRERAKRLHVTSVNRRAARVTPV